MLSIEHASGRGCAAVTPARSSGPRAKTVRVAVVRLLSGWLLAVFTLLSSGAAQVQAQEGEPRPAVDIELFDGGVLAAKTLRGKVVLHVFSATWCHVCVAEMPELQALHAAYAGRGFEVVALSLDASSDDAKGYWRARDFRFPAAMRTRELRSAFGDLHGTPTFVLSDRKGVVRVRRTGAFEPGELERLLTALL